MILRACFFLFGLVIWPAASRKLVDTLLVDVNEITWLQEAGASPHSSNRFVGSPSIINTSTGWLASHDYFFDTPVGTVSVFASPDGVDWVPAANISAIYWAQLFAVGSQVYLIGPSGDITGQGDLKISACLSDPCDGKSWSEAAVLVTGTTAKHFHSAPTPIATDGKTLYRAMEVAGTDIPTGDLGIVMLTAPVSCLNLTTPSCWTVSEPLLWNSSWMPPSTVQAHWHPLDGVAEASRRSATTPGSALVELSSESRAWEEANAVVMANGSVFAMVRLDSPLAGCTEEATCNRAALLAYQGGELAFDSIVSMPTGCNKFAIRQSPGDGFFYSLTNPVDEYGIAEGTCGQRNHLLLARSQDLRSWQSCHFVMYDDTGFDDDTSVGHTGFQYVDFRFDGNDLVTAVRAGYRGSVTYHDANRLLSQRITSFASLCNSTQVGL